jgi:hypothetical protein
MRITTLVAPPQIFVNMVKLMREAVSVALVLFPALYGWWVGRRLVRRIEDPAFPELHAAHQRWVAIALGVCLVVGIATSTDFALGKIALAVLATLVASFSLRRAIFHERRGLLQYVTFTVRAHCRTHGRRGCGSRRHRRRGAHPAVGPSGDGHLRRRAAGHAPGGS